MAATTFSMTCLRAALPSSGSSLASSKSCESRIAVTPRSQVGTSLRIQSFSGLRAANPLQLKAGSAAIDEITSLVSNGSRWFAMRHSKRVPRLGRPADQRKALIRGLTTELLRHGKIKTTHPRARAIRKYVDKMITLAKGGTLHERRQALGFIYDKGIVHKMFEQIPTLPAYTERDGGYTKITRTMPRRGDNAPMAFIELLDTPPSSKGDYVDREEDDEEEEEELAVA